MTIVLPIFFAACGIGLFARRFTAAHWAAMAFIIFVVLLYNFVKPPKPLVPDSSGGPTIPAQSAEASGS